MFAPHGGYSSGQSYVNPPGGFGPIHHGGGYPHGGVMPQMPPHNGFMPQPGTFPGNFGPQQPQQNSSGRGSPCYSCNARINQRPETGRNDYRIQIDARHNGNHSCDQQWLTVEFNRPVTFVSCSNGNIYSGNGTPFITVGLRYHNNQNDNIGMGDFIVQSQFQDVQIINSYIQCGSAQ